MRKLTVPYVDLRMQNKPYGPALHDALDKILLSGNFILGDAVESFEQEVCNQLGCADCIGVGSGTDALFLALKALGIGDGDEVITVSNSYLASVSSIALTGATPVLADVNDDLNIDCSGVETLITERTRALICVHLTGSPANLDALSRICSIHSIHLIEDCAQAIGASYRGQSVGNFGVMGCFSMHPLKNLGVLGDGGFITTNEPRLTEALRLARNHGHSSRDDCKFWSHNMRLDALQASFASVKLAGLTKVIEARQRLASIYLRNLSDVNQIILPTHLKESMPAYHTFVIRCEARDELSQFLLDNGVETKIHYPYPVHKMAVGRKYFGSIYLPKTEVYATQILSLPVGEYLEETQIHYVCRLIKDFYT